MESPRTPDGRSYRAWTWSGRPHDLLTVRLVGSEFQPHLLLLEETGAGYRLLDEARATDVGAGIAGVAELPEQGRCLVVVTSANGQGGEFDVTVESRPLPDFKGPKGESGSGYALLAGAGEYPGQGSDLPGIGSDLELMKEMLLNYGFDPANILILSDRDITRTRLARAFIEHLGRAPRDGLALFYYSGHGIRLNDNIGLTGVADPESDDGRDEALLMTDGSLILDDELGYLADQLPADQILMILDSCFSGTASRGPAFQKEVQFSKARIYLDFPKRFLFDETDHFQKGTAVEVGSWTGGNLLLAAAREHEPAMVIAAPGEGRAADSIPTGPRKYVSLFTYCLAEVAALHPEGLTLSSMMDSISIRMKSIETSLELSDQTPVLHGAGKDVSLKEVLMRTRGAP